MDNNFKWDEFEETSPASEGFNWDSFEEDNLDKTKKWVEDIKSPETSQLEAAVGGVAEGASFGFLDELTGLAGAGLETVANKLNLFEPSSEDIAKNISPELRQKIGQIESPAMPVQASPVDIYKRYRDLQRNKLEQMREEHPGTMLTGNLAGGFMIPGVGAAKGIKGAQTLGKKALEAVKQGALLGGVSGAGVSEAENIPDLTQDVISGAKLGGALGGGLPLVGAAAGQVAKLPGKLGQTDLGKIYKSYLKGDKLAENIRENFQKLKDLGGQVSSELGNRASQEGKQMAALIEEATVAGNTSDVLPILQQSKARLTEMLADPDENTAKSAKQLIAVIDNILEGKETTKLVPKMTPQEKDLKRQQDILKAFNQLSKKRIQQGLSDSEEVAFNKLANKKAEIEAKATKPIDFDEPDIYTSAEGKRVATQKTARDPEKQEMIDAFESGDAPHLGTLPEEELYGQQKTITQIIDDPDLTPIEFKVDEETGLEYLTYMNNSTGKVESQFIPDRTELFNQLKAVKVREGGKSQLTPEDIQKTRQSFRQYTPMYSPGTPAVVGKEATGVVSELSKLLPENVQEQSSKVSQFKSLFEQMTGKDSAAVLSNAEKGQVREKLGNLLLEASPEAQSKTKLKDLLEGFADPTRPDVNVKGLQEVAPDLAARISQESPDIAEKIRLGISIDPNELKTISPDLRSQILSQFGGGFGLARKAAAKLGTATKSVGEFSKDITDSLVSASPELLNRTITKLARGTDIVSKNLANALSKINEKDKRGRQAILFGIMQNPEYRKKLEEMRYDLGVTSETDK